MARLRATHPRTRRAFGVLICVVLKRKFNWMLGQFMQPIATEPDYGWIRVTNRNDVAVALEALTDIHADKVAKGRLRAENPEFVVALLVGEFPLEPIPSLHH